MNNIILKFKIKIMLLHAELFVFGNSLCSSHYKSMRLMGKSIGLIQIDIPIDHQVGEGL